MRNELKTANLCAIGLTPLEASCFLALYVEPRGSTASALARATQLRRTSVYRALKALERKGFAKSWHVIGTTQYTALPLHEALSRQLMAIWQS